MKHKTAELEGDALDYLVQCAERNEKPIMSVAEWAAENDDGYNPSGRWDHGGPIIEREGIEIWKWKGADGAYWVANVDGRDSGSIPHATGPTALIAAMRAFVTSKLGDEVELP